MSKYSITKDLPDGGSFLTTGTKSGLAGTDGNRSDTIRIKGGISANPLVTSLYYYSNNMTQDATSEPTTIYSPVWNLQE